MTLATIMLHWAAVFILGSHAYIFILALQPTFRKMREDRAARERLRKACLELRTRSARCWVRLARLRPLRGSSPAHVLAVDMSRTLPQLLARVDRTVRDLPEAVSLGMFERAERLAEDTAVIAGVAESILEFREKRLPEMAAFHSTIAVQALDDVIRLRDFVLARVKGSRGAAGAEGVPLDEEIRCLQMLTNAFAALRTLADADPEAVVRTVMRQRAFIQEIATLARQRVDAYRYVHVCAADAALYAKMARSNARGLAEQGKSSATIAILAEAAVRTAASLTRAEGELAKAVSLVDRSSVQIGRSDRTRRRQRRAMMLAGRAHATIQAIDSQIELLLGLSREYSPQLEHPSH